MKSPLHESPTDAVGLVTVRRIKRTVPPAAAPIYLKDIVYGIGGIIRGRREMERFRRDISRHFGVRFCFPLSSGKAAIYLILKALKTLHPDRSEVIIPAFCCYSVPSAIKRAGMNIRLCEVDPDTLDYDFENLDRLIKQLDCQPGDPVKMDYRRSENTSAANDGTARRKKLLAIISVHLFGSTADVFRVRRIVSEPDIRIIEDAAQVMGAASGQAAHGTAGDVGFFSFGRGKSISAIEGGLIVTNDREIGEQIAEEFEKISRYPVAAKMKLLFLAFALFIFQRPNLFWIPKLIPALKLGETIYDPNFSIRKMSSFQIGLLRNWKQKLTRFSDARNRAALKWSESKSLRAFAKPVRYNKAQENNFIRYPVRVDNIGMWGRLLRMSAEKGLGIMTTYPDSIDGIKELQNEFDGQVFRNAHNLSRQLLTLPVHPLLSRNDENKIAACLDMVAEVNGKSDFKAVANRWP